MTSLLKIFDIIKLILPGIVDFVLKRINSKRNTRNLKDFIVEVKTPLSELHDTTFENFDQYVMKYSMVRHITDKYIQEIQTTTEMGSVIKFICDVISYYINTRMTIQTQDISAERRLLHYLEDMLHHEISKLEGKYINKGG